MSLLQLPNVIKAVNELALKVQKLEVQVQTLLEDRPKQQQVPKATTANKKND